MVSEAREATGVLSAAFMGWQCRCRQVLMREFDGRPGEAITPAVRLGADQEPLGHVVTILSKEPGHSMVPEFRHLCRRSNDPAERRKKALQLFCERYYQQPETFSEMLTATFAAGSVGCAAIVAAKEVVLEFAAYGQGFTLDCLTFLLAPDHPHYQATYWHNQLFNPALRPDIQVVGFQPVWSKSRSDPPVPVR